VDLRRDRRDDVLRIADSVAVATSKREKYLLVEQEIRYNVSYCVYRISYCVLKAFFVRSRYVRSFTLGGHKV